MDDADNDDDDDVFIYLPHTFEHFSILAVRKTRITAGIVIIATYLSVINKFVKKSLPQKQT